MKKTKLPRKMSALIRLALADLAKVERQPKVYTVDMGRWHEPYQQLTSGAEKCAVCFAGAVMAGTLGLKPTDDYATAKLGDGNEEAIRALDALRQGDVSTAADELGLSRSRSVDGFDRHIPNYTPRTRLKFRREMFRLARDLERGGL